MVDSDNNPSSIDRLVTLLSKNNRFLWQGRLGDAFWKTGTLISLVVNIVLIVTLILTLRYLFSLKEVIANQLISGLHSNFVQMDQATINTTVTVEDTIPVQFDLPVQKKTTVRLTEDTFINDAQVTITTPYLNINAPADIILPKDLLLPIKLDMVVPVDTQIPILITVPVSIPLEETELHQPFTGLQNVVQPYQTMLNQSPDSWQEVPWCQGLQGLLCRWLFTP